MVATWDQSACLRQISRFGASKATAQPAPGTGNSAYPTESKHRAKRPKKSAFREFPGDGTKRAKRQSGGAILQGADGQAAMRGFISIRRLLIALLAGSPSVFGQAIWYVNQNALGSNTGTSWAAAFIDLQDALEAAQSGDDIWVTSGRHTPDRGTADRFASFVLVPGVSLYGGFEGTEECLDQRKLTAGLTILSGDLNGDDGPRDCDKVSNCCRRWDSPGCDDALCQQLVCTWEPRCCKFGDYPFDAYCAYLASVECCHLGSARRCENSYIVVDARAPAESTYVLDGFQVSGAYISIPDAHQFVGGYGLYLLDNSLLLHNCLFEENGSAGVRYDKAIVSVSASSFVANRDYGLYGDDTSLTINECEFAENRWAVDNSADPLNGAGNSLSNTKFRKNTTPLVLGGPSVVSNCLFEDNKDHAIYHSGNSLAVTNSILLRNGGVFHSASTMYMSNCIILSNSQGPAIASQFGLAHISNCLFSGSYVYQGESKLTMTNCVIAGKRSPMNVAALRLKSASVARLRNCILWDNFGDGNGGEGDQIELSDDSQLEIDHSIVQGWTGVYGGVGNSGDDPLFVNQLGNDGLPGTLDDDLRLASGSPAINTGNTILRDLPATDLDGHARVLCGQVDIGAYEFGIGDYNCDQSVDLCDQAIWPGCMTTPQPGAIFPGCEAFDFDADSDVDLADFAGQQRVVIPH